MGKILVVDDDEQVLVMLQNTLEREGYEVLVAGDGLQAVEMFQPGEVSLVITDIVMPGKEGIETIMELLSRDPDLPIIAISGGGRINPEDYLKWVKRFGVEHTFTKPVDKDELLAAVAELMPAQVS